MTMNTVTVYAWVIGLAFFAGFGVNEMLNKLIRFLETLKK